MWDFIDCVRRGAQPPLDPAGSNFLVFCLQHRDDTRAQLMQDLYVLYKLQKTSGFFVEFGATDGTTISNTFLLESRFWWTGVVAEPLHTWHPGLTASRKCSVDLRCVWTRSDEELEFLAPADTPELATLNSFRDVKDGGQQKRATNATVVKVKTVSLNDLLLKNEAPRHFDYLSVDTEGSELAILGAWDADRWRPRIITVEHNYVEEQREQIRTLLNSYGYVRELEMFSKWDDWYFYPGLMPGGSV